MTVYFKPIVLIQYFENGQVELKGTISDEVPIGYEVFYYEDERLYYKDKHVQGAGVLID